MFAIEITGDGRKRVWHLHLDTLRQKLREKEQNRIPGEALVGKEKKKLRESSQVLASYMAIV